MYLGLLLSHLSATFILLVKHTNGKEVMEKMTKEAIIRGLNKFRPFEMGDDPVLWRQSDTIDRVMTYLEEVL